MDNYPCRTCMKEQPLENYTPTQKKKIAKARPAECATCQNAAARVRNKAARAAKAARQLRSNLNPWGHKRWT